MSADRTRLWRQRTQAGLGVMHLPAHREATAAFLISAGYLPRRRYAGEEYHWHDVELAAARFWSEMVTKGEVE